MNTEVICEIGVNHQNDIGVARELVGMARAFGAQTAKFQCSTVIEEVSFFHAPDHFRELGALVPTTSFLRQCANICYDAGIEFLCTPSGPESLKIVVDLGVRRIKVASDSLNNPMFLRLVQATELPVILSTGMGTLREVEDAFGCVKSLDTTTILHCVSAYPCPVDQANLRAILTLRREFGDVATIGYSDHTTSVTLPAAAVALGAMVIEKHITLDRSMKGPDHQASLDPLDFAVMMENIRELEAALGDGRKVPQEIEAEGKALYRKSVVASRPIAKGEAFTMDNMAVKRPGGGYQPDMIYVMVGQTALRDFAEDEQVR